MNSILLVLYYGWILSLATLINGYEQKPLGATRAPLKRVAIIGAGAGGSSSAYNLRKYADQSLLDVNITVFERASYVGGRSTTVNVFDDPAYPIELGASIFVSVNHNLVNASRELGLMVKGAGEDRPGESEETIGIWDGKRFVYILSDSLSWWNIAKLVWRYGLAPVRAQTLMKTTVGKFLRLYEEPLFPFKSLTAAAAEVGLLDTTSVTGEVFLEENSVSPKFSREIIQASTRVNYGQNLPVIHGLEAMVCMATDGAMAIQGGNWQIFAGMLSASEANVRLESTVRSIDRNDDGTLTITSTSAGSDMETDVFDEVVIAGPLQDSGISISPPPERIPDEIPYVELYVTLFSSPHRLSPKYFDLAGSGKTVVPETVLTTLPEDSNLPPSQSGVGPAGFWSISTLRTVNSPGSASSPAKHYVYKIFSPQRVTAKFVSQILGLEEEEKEGRDSTVFADNSSIEDLPKHHISWFHEKIWNPYPVLHPRVTFEEAVLAPNMWYTSGMESFISTMETSALMGKNVAALMFQSWFGGEAEYDGSQTFWEKSGI
ncbi:hypothetical protein ASPZODRAFT_138495 [Penicilliopsis zonata CBS 506.65]|uniref:Prenylcysteine lyase domain-containing protein n=1 Tax=Penicilliopsis zonata CBS 506.65 TaxID=1073090 RepID=A0A1L9SWA9_9EURO|nr:hypothetical protein ASPZODRAFT_138495 [Penicilliopsis zonata CBS 506.65]OJJ51397.1 hypothetical protein ASPZODRAFT_138495 [Penicilliopsis zonata CBS 506.65]